jgi:hypothetical protein
MRGGNKKVMVKRIQDQCFYDGGFYVELGGELFTRNAI